jgi:hypothetical protein
MTQVGAPRTLEISVRPTMQITIAPHKLRSDDIPPWAATQRLIRRCHASRERIQDQRTCTDLRFACRGVIAGVAIREA